MHFCRLVGALSIGLILGLCTTRAWAYEPTQATTTLLDQNPGLLVLAQEDQLAALYGAILASDSDSATTTDDFVNSFLAAHADALGVDDVSLIFEEKVTAGNSLIYTYTQEIESLPVENSVVKIPVFLGATETICHIGIRLTPHPGSALPADLLTANDATNVVSQSPDYGHLTTFSTPEKVIFEDDDRILHRAWRLNGLDDDESYLFYVDTNSGNMVGIINQVYSGTVSGTVTGYATPGVMSDNPNNVNSCPAPAAMRGVQVSVLGGEEDQEFANLEGEYGPLSDSRDEFTVESQLIGEWVTVVDSAEMDLIVSGSVTPSISQVELVFNDVAEDCNLQSQQETATAQVNAFLHAQGTHDWFKKLDPSAVQIDQNVTATVNLTGFCTASFSVTANGPSIRLSQSSVLYGCMNSASSTIVSHEYGHFISVHQHGGRRWSTEMLEGVADVIASLRLNSPLMGSDWITALGGDPIRDLDTDVRLDIPDTYYMHCAQCYNRLAGHCPGVALGGAFWDLSKRLRCCSNDPDDGECADDPIALCTEATVATDCQVGQYCSDRPTEELASRFMSLTVGILDDRVIGEVLCADDDDGNPGSDPPTPHYTMILETFADLHGWPPDPLALDQGGVIVEWDGPPGDPTLGVDYIVEFDAPRPPNVTLITTEKVVPVDRWFIGRIDSRSGQPGDLGTITADWAAPSDQNIAVQVGGLATVPCRSVNVVDIPAQSVSNFSNIQLNLTGHLTEKAKCVPVAGTCNGGTNDGLSCTAELDCPGGDCSASVGGLIEGTVAGKAQGIEARGIGSGDSQPGSLDIGNLFRSLGTASIDTIPPGSSLDICTWRNAQIHGEFHGTIQTRTDLSGLIISGEGVSTGNLEVAGAITFRIDIKGDMEGDIHASARLSARVRIDGEFGGDICGSNISTDTPLDQQLGSGSSILLGPKGTVCGDNCPFATSDRTYYVDQAAAPGGDGRSWAMAYKDLQDALDDAVAATKAVEIWVADGTYLPSVETIPGVPRSVTFELPDRLQIYGGFTGTETRRCQRDPGVNRPILSGDLNGDDNVQNYDDNAYHVLTVSGTGDRARIDGFTITAGNATSSNGGAIVIDNANPTITNCRIYLNRAVQGGGVQINNSASPVFSDCLFTDNTAVGSFPQLAGNGGAVLVSNISNPEFVNCTFVANFSQNADAIHNASSGTPLITNCILWDNVYILANGPPKPAIVGTATVNYSLVQDDVPNDGIVWDGTGNIDIDPEFLDPGPGDIFGFPSRTLQVYASSPSIEVGNNPSIDATVALTDLAGDERRVDADQDGNAQVDLGVYEFSAGVPVQAATTPSGEAGFTKDRYISFVPGNAGSQVAVRVTLVSSTLFSITIVPPWQWWVGAPVEVSENSGVVDPAAAPTFPTFMASTLECAPVYYDWTGISEVHVYDEATVPDAIYHVQMIPENGDTSDEQAYSAPLVISTSIWGDIVGYLDLGPNYWTGPDGSVDFTSDVTAVLDKFTNASNAPLKSRADQDPNEPDRLINISDVTFVLGAFGGDDYPFTNAGEGPQPCP